jgi:transcriptional regulator with XRE-family HTH domain
MVAKQRAVDRGTERGLRLIRTIGAEIRLARQRLGLSLHSVAAAVGISGPELSRIERAKAEWVSLLSLARLCSVVGLDLTARAYPGGSAVRDARHGRLLVRFHGLIQASLSGADEVPFPNPGDQRAWDAMIRGDGWRYGVEAELNPIDGQALLRRLNLKQRDGMVDGVILLLPGTRQVRLFRREFAEQLASKFPVRQAIALRRLAAGQDPGGSTIVTL